MIVAELLIDSIIIAVNTDHVIPLVSFLEILCTSDCISLMNNFVEKNTAEVIF